MNPPAKDLYSVLESSPMHKLLVRSNALQQLSRPLVFALMLANGLVTALVWGAFNETSIAILAGGLTFLASAGNWLALWLLPRAGRSYGPDQPSALALMLIFTGLALVLAILNAPLWLLALLNALITLAAIYATWIEPFQLGVTRETLDISTGDPAVTSGASVRLLHIGDIHVEHLTQRERQLNQLIEQLQPDVIVFTGDFVNLSYNEDARSHAEIRQLIGGWQAPLGVYCISGTPTVEPPALVASLVRGIPQITLLTNRWVTLNTPAGKLHIAGMVTTHDMDEDRRALANLAADFPESGIRLLLSHSPDLAPEAAAVGFDLYLCGHTHGGQLRVPILGAILSASHYGRRFVMGRYRLNEMTLYTTRGVGMEGLGAPRARFLCPPEIVLWKIVAKKQIQKT